MDWDCISNIASIITCVLFAFYIIGRLWTIKKETYFGTESFKGVTSEEKMEHDLELDFGGMATIEVISSMAYKSITVKEVKSYDNNSFTVRSYGRRLSLEKINAYTPIYIIINLPETIPTYVVEFVREDGIKGYYEIYSSGKTGEIIPLNYRLNHTFSSFCYYLCR